MNFANNPQLLDKLAASYALGTLRGGARRRFEAVSRQSATVRASALIWQERFSSMTELQAVHAPSPNVWKRIENLLVNERPVAQPVVPIEESPLFIHLRRAMGWWRGAALGVGVAAAAAVVVGLNLSRAVDLQSGLLAQAAQRTSVVERERARLQAQLNTLPAIEYVAVLVDDAATPTLLVTFDRKNQLLVVKRVGTYQEAPDKSLQLWALPPASAPRSLGVLRSDVVMRMTTVEGQVAQVPALAVSLEPRGGVPGEGGPTGPVLFKGALLQTTL